MFKVVDELFGDADSQCVATIKQNQLGEVKSILTKQEYYEIVEQDTMLILTD